MLLAAPKVGNWKVNAYTHKFLVVVKTNLVKT